MSTTIDERVVEMRFDNRQFEQNVQTSLSTIEKLKQSLKLTDASKGLENLNEAAKKCDVSGLSNGVEAARVKFSALQVMGVTALVRIANAAISAGEKIVSALAIDPIITGFEEYEIKMNAVQTIMSNTASKGTTMADVTETLDELNLYADKTIYNFAEMTRNIGTFTAAGVGLKESATAIQGIANLAAASGSNSLQASTAMYQLSQALAAGTVKLEDWNSVVNAGMGGEKFQEALKETARRHGIAVDKMIKKNGSFRESLQEGWITAEVLNETLSNFTVKGANEYSKAMMEAGKWTQEQADAFVAEAQSMEDAATKVKTFTQLWDTLKESAQSGWSQSWETIIGDFEEAKDFFTQISDMLGNAINESANARNDVLFAGLSSGWKQLLAQGVNDAKGFQDTVIAVAKEHGVAVDDMIKSAGSFEKSLKEGWLTSDILSESISNLADKTRGLSDKELEALGYTRSQVEAFEEFEAATKNGSISLDEFAEKMTQLSGRENLIQALLNVFKAVASVVKPIKEAFRDIFPPITAEQLYSFTEGLRELTSHFILSDKTMENLKNTFRGLFAVLDLVKQVFTAILKPVIFLLSGTDDLVGGILAITGSFGNFIAGIDEVIKKSDIFNKIVQGIIGVAEGAVAIIKSLSKNIGTMFDLPDIGGIIDSMGAAVLGGGFLQALQTLWNGVKSIASGILNAVKSLASVLSDTIGNIDFGGFFDFINTLSFGGIAVAISKFLKSFTEPFEGIQDIFDGIPDVLDGVRGCFEAYQTQLKAGTLLKIAGAIGILAAALLVISSIDGEKLNASLGAITVMFANLIGAMAIFAKMSFNIVGVTKAVVAMVGMSTAVLILAGALKKIGDLDTGHIASALAGVAGLTAIVVTAAKVMSSGSGAIVKGAGSMVIFAAAINILASVCRDLAQLSWNELAKGLTGVGVLLASVSVFLKTAELSAKPAITAAGIVILAGAIKILASACQTFGQMSWEDVAKGLLSVGTLLLEVAAFTKLTANAKNVIATAAALLIIGTAMNSFAQALSGFGGLSLEAIGKGLLAMGGALAEVALAVKIMPVNMVVIGAGLIVVAQALKGLSEALGQMGGMSWEQMAIGLISMGGALAVLAAGLTVMNSTLAGSAAMLVAAAALSVLSKVLVTLGNLSWGGIAKGLATLAGAFTIIGVAGAVLTPLIPTILSLAGAFTLIGIAVLGIGTGLLAAGAGLSALAVGFTALAAAGTAGAAAVVAALTVIISGIIDLIPTVIVKIGEGLIAVCDVIAAGAPAIGNAVKAVILSLVDVLTECVPAIVDGAMVLISEVLAALAEYAPQITDSLLQLLIGILDSLAADMPELLQKAVDVIASFFAGITDAIKGLDSDVLIKGAAGVGILAAVMLALGALSSLIPAAMTGVLGLGVLIGELALVLAAIGLLEQIPGLNWLINEGGKLLEDIGAAIGSFVGGIVGGVMSGISGQLPQIGSDLSAFMTNIQPFIQVASGIDASMMDGIKALAEAILLLTAADLVDGLASWLTGGSSIVEFGAELVKFGSYFNQYYQSISGIDGAVVEASANAAKALSEMAKNLPKSGGAAQWFSGESSISAFADELVKFGPKLKQYADSIQGLNADVVVNSANAAKALAEMADNLPNSGGLVSLFTGENNLSQFVEQLAEFGPKLKEYANSVQGLDSNVVVNSANAAKALSEMAENLPNSGGLAGLFAGNNDMDKFGRSLVSFGESFAQYASNIQGIDSNAIVSTANALSKLVSSISNLDGGEMNKLSSTLKSLGESGVDEFVGAFSDSSSKVSQAASDMLTTFVDGINANKESITTAFNNMAKTAVTAIKGTYSDFYDAGKYVAKGFADGISSNAYLAKAKASEMAKAAEVAARVALGIHSPSKAFISIGNYIGEGLAQGIRDSSKKAVSSTKETANKVAKAAKMTFDKAEKWIEETKYFNELTLEEELEIWEKMIARYKKGSEERLKAEKNAYKIYEELYKQQYQNSIDWIEREKNYNRLSLEEELAAWERVQARYKVGTDERKKADLEVYNLKHELISSSISLIEKEIAVQKELLATYAEGSTAYKNTVKEINNLETQLLEAKYQNSMNWIEQEKNYNRLSLEEELAAWQRVQARYKEGTAERKEIDLEVYNLKHELIDGSVDLIEKEIEVQNRLLSTYEQGSTAYKNTVKEINNLEMKLIDAKYQSTMDWIEEEKHYNRLSLSDELAAYIRMQQMYKKGSAERKKLDREVYNLQKEINSARETYNTNVARVERERNEKRVQLEKEYADKVKQINEQLAQDIKSTDDEYVNALESRTNSLYNSYGLFSEVSKKKQVSSSTLMKNLQDQVAEFNDWNQVLKQLSARGLNSALIEELEEMGPSAIAEIKALNDMSDAELAQYATLWATKHKEAKDQAVKELENLRIETQSKIAELRVVASQELDDYRDTWNQQMYELNRSANEELADLRKDFETQVGILKRNTEKDVKEMTKNVQAIMKQAGWNELGQQIVEGLTEGVQTKKTTFVGKLVNVVTAGVAAVKGALGIHSPSKVFAEIGQYIDEGIISGIESYGKKVEDVSADVGNRAADSMSRAINNAAELIDDGIDAEPAIRPVIDLTNVNRSLEQIDGAFAANRSMELGMNVAYGYQNGNNSHTDDMINKISELNAQANSKIVNAVEGLKDDFAELLNKLGKLQVVMDTGSLVGAITPEMDRSLGVAAVINRRGNL